MLNMGQFQNILNIGTCFVKFGWGIALAKLSNSLVCTQNIVPHTFPIDSGIKAGLAGIVAQLSIDKKIIKLFKYTSKWCISDK